MWPIRNNDYQFLFLWGPFGQYLLWSQDKDIFRNTDETGSRLEIMQIFYCYQDVPILQSLSQKSADVSNDVITEWPNYFQKLSRYICWTLGKFHRKVFDLSGITKIVPPLPPPIPKFSTTNFLVSLKESQFQIKWEKASWNNKRPRLEVRISMRSILGSLCHNTKESEFA